MSNRFSLCLGLLIDVSDSWPLLNRFLLFNQVFAMFLLVVASCDVVLDSCLRLSVTPICHTIL